MAKSIDAAMRAAERENKARRNILEIARPVRIEDYLWEEVHSGANLLANGSERKLRSVRAHWLRQLFTDEVVWKQPVIVLGKEESAANELREELSNGTLSRCRTFVQVDVAHACYAPFLGMNYEQIQRVAQGVAERRGVASPNWNILQGFCELLEKYGYEKEIGNLCKLFEQETPYIVDLLEEAGILYAAQAIRDSSATFQQTAEVFRILQRNLASICADDNTGYSLVQSVTEELGQASAPFFYLVLRDNVREDFLEYLAEELRAVSSYQNPILVLDSIALSDYLGRGQSSQFCQYLMSAGNLSLSVLGQDCAALFPRDTLHEFLGRYHFQMILAESTDAVETLTESTVGKYEHILVDENSQKYREFLHIFPHGSNSGWGNHKEQRLRIRGMDLREVGERGCYVSRMSEAYYYKNMIFD